MKKVSYRSQKVGESENATNILSKLKAYLSLQSLLIVGVHWWGIKQVLPAHTEREKGEVNTVTTPTVQLVSGSMYTHVDHV